MKKSLYHFENSHYEQLDKDVENNKYKLTGLICKQNESFLSKLDK